MVHVLLVLIVVFFIFVFELLFIFLVHDGRVRDAFLHLAKGFLVEQRQHYVLDQFVCVRADNSGSEDLASLSDALEGLFNDLFVVLLLKDLEVMGENIGVKVLHNLGRNGHATLGPGELVFIPREVPEQTDSNLKVCHANVVSDVFVEVVCNISKHVNDLLESRKDETAAEEANVA